MRFGVLVCQSFFPIMKTAFALCFIAVVLAIANGQNGPPSGSPPSGTPPSGCPPTTGNAPPGAPPPPPHCTQSGSSTQDETSSTSTTG